MSNWTQCGGPFVWQRRFGIKVGHVAKRDSGWVALFDGKSLGMFSTSVKARSQVDSAGGVC